MASSNIFVSIAGRGPPPQIPQQSPHPVPRKGITSGLNKPIDTNKFWANLVLGTQTQSVWTHPYSFQWAHGEGNASSWGIGIQHIERSQTALGDGNPPRFFINPIKIWSIIMSDASLGNSTTLTVDNLSAFSANVQLSPNAGNPVMTMPLVQGMGLCTAIYKKGSPVINSGIFFRSFTGPVVVGSSYKWRIVCEDNRTWVMYVTPGVASGNAPSFSLKSNTTIAGPVGFDGIIQVAKLPCAADEATYDRTAGSYPTGCNVLGSVNGAVGNYTFRWRKQGSKPLLMFALPHHVESFTKATLANRAGLQLQTTTKGIAAAVLADQWTMQEPNMPVEMGFAPWTPTKKNVTTFASNVVRAMNLAAASELNQNIDAQTNLDSMYFAGKGLAKFAALVLATHEFANNPALAATGLTKLKNAFAVFINNKQINPLVYDRTWKGVVSSGGYKDPSVDFGNTNYNDHHFHYGYHVYTAAVIGHLDPTWLREGTNRQWVNMLVRDYSNPVADDLFPFSRSFDWYHGHSWAKGLFESGDGKDEESSSEDCFASYAIKLWGKVIGDFNMESRGNMMLSIQARSINNYFLLADDNKNQPPQFIPNKVSGILFENKCDHATYFGLNPEYIQGIHMIPLMPYSAFIRRPEFVRQEWDRYFSNGRVDNVEGGWRGILYANYSLVNPKAAYAFFSQSGFDDGWLDGGASKTWYLAYTAALGGA